MQINCEECVYFEYDENDDMWYCSVNMDEDDYMRLVQNNYRNCPYFRNGDEYAVVRHQM